MSQNRDSVKMCFSSQDLGCKKSFELYDLKLRLFLTKITGVDFRLCSLVCCD